MQLKKIRPWWGSHLPILKKAIQLSTGDVVECGCGIFSTPFLHWECLNIGRNLRTYEGNKDWYELFSLFNTPHHSMTYVSNWDDVDLSLPVGVALIDHQPDERRWKEAIRLLHADFVILHDAGGKDGINNGYNRLEGIFKYRWLYKNTKPKTAVVSNIFDCKRLFT